MDEPHASQLARDAVRFALKLRHLPDDLDPGRLSRPGSPWAGIAALEGTARARAVTHWFPHLVGPWPSLDRLQQRAGRLALGDRRALLRGWCLLALAARPGALRCCIEREVRNALRSLIGDAFEPLAARSGQGRAVSGRATAWKPLHWACIGHVEWIGLLSPEDATLRRMARLSLPPGVRGMSGALAEAPAEMPPAAAAAALDEMGVEWTC